MERGWLASKIIAEHGLWVHACSIPQQEGWRKFTMAAAGVMFEIGGIILAAAMNYEMLVIGRCFLGVAVSARPSHAPAFCCNAM